MSDKEEETLEKREQMYSAAAEEALAPRSGRSWLAEQERSVEAILIIFARFGGELKQNKVEGDRGKRISLSVKSSRLYPQIKL